MMRAIAVSVVLLLGLAGCVSAPATQPAPSAASADAISRGTLSRKFIDYCVYTQYRVDGVDRKSLVQKCQCAAKDAISRETGDSFPAPSRSKLTPEQEANARTGIAACFPKKA